MPQHATTHDSGSVRYYELFADLIGIYWQFHKDRIAKGNISFCMMNDTRHWTGAIPFDPSIPRMNLEHNSFIEPRGIIEHYADSLGKTLKGSWQQFLENIGRTSQMGLLDSIPLVQSSRKFFDAYTRSLAYECETAGHAFSKAFTDSEASSFTLSRLGNQGIHSGATVTTQLIALFREEFHPRLATILSKVSLKYVAVTRTGIGIAEPHPYDRKTLLRSDYHLLDDSPLGLDTVELKRLGLGEAMGCPASMRVSPDTYAFLTSIGAKATHNSMLDELAAMTQIDFETSVGEWYRGLTPHGRKSLLLQKDADILSGRTRKEAIHTSRCPFGKER